MVRIKQAMQYKVVRASGDDTGSDSGGSDEIGDEENKIDDASLSKEEESVVSRASSGEETRENRYLNDFEREVVDRKGICEKDATKNENLKESLKNSITKGDNCENSESQKSTVYNSKMPLEMENVKKEVNEKHDRHVKSSGGEKGAEKRADTPPLKRLMRQDPLPLFMHDKGPTPPKKIFRDELYSRKYNAPFLSASNLSMIKHAPTHPRQAMLKSKHYTNKVQRPYSHQSPFTVPKTILDDQPLDLSKKGSGKSSLGFVKKEPDLDTKKSPGKYTNGFLSNVKHSSLQNLQKKFGGDFQMRSHRRPMSGLLSNVPSRLVPKSHSAVHMNSHVNSMRTESPQKYSASSSSPFISNSSHHVSSEQIKHERKEKSETSDTKSENARDKDQNSNLTAKSETDTEGSEDSSIYTIHKCSCQKSFNSLYGLSLHLQESGHLPAGTKQASLLEYPKLVRGQDMWLNQESEQTKRILRCIQCGESFKSLPMLTVHMMQTQHYAKIVSSEHGRRSHKCSAYCDRDMDRECIFKCKVCNSAFTDMEGLANHMILSGHHKKNILRSHSYLDFGLKSKRKRFSSGEDYMEMSPSSTVASLLEYKRKYIGDAPSPSSNGHSRLSESPGSDIQEDSRITCENCGKKIETGFFVDHVRACLLHSKYDVSNSSPKLSKTDNISVKLEPKLHDVDDVEEDEDDEKMFEKPLESEEEGEKMIETRMKNESSEFQTNSETETRSNETETLSDKDKNVDEKGETTQSLSDDTKPVTRNPSSSKLTESRQKLDIIDPNCEIEENKEGNSALQAMESFIQKSFSSKFNFRRGNMRFISSEKQVPNHIPSIESRKSPMFQIEKYRKYFQHVYHNNDSAEKSSEKLKDETKSPVSYSSRDDLEKLEKMCENVKATKSPIADEEDKKSSKSDRPQSHSPEVNGEALVSKYLNVEEENSESAKKSSSSASALDSLSSFVYGQPLTSEHPLDSLQKLLTKTDIPKFMASRSVKCFPRVSTPENAMPLNLSLKKDIADDEYGNIDKEALSDPDSSASGSDSDTNIEYRCAACSRHFASKGSYRYHLSRCHLSSVKKYGIKEAFSMSPYIYLPLDHTAKFSKYYEMAHELANKGK